MAAAFILAYGAAAWLLSYVAITTYRFIAGSKS